MINFGIVKPGVTLRIPFDTFASSTGAPTALSNFAVGDILIYKDGSTTERASTTGYTATTTFDSVTGINEAVIDLSSDATADFFKAGSNYVVVISPVTADGQTLSFVAAVFTIGHPDAVLNTSIATLSSQTSFTLTSGPAEDDALNGMWAIVFDKASAVQWTWVQILDYTGSTKTVTLAALPATTFTIAAIDNFCVMGPMPLQPTVIGTFLDVSATGEAGVDWANVGGKTTVNALTNTSIITTQKVDVDTIKTNAVVNGGTVTFPSNKTLTSTDLLPTALTANGNIKASMVEILTTALTETAGLLAGGFKKFFNIASPASTMDVIARVTLADTLTTYTGNTVQTGDSYAIVNSGTFGNSALKTLIDAVDDYVDTEVAAILAAVDTEVAAIKAKTDQLTFTVANVVNANSLRVNGDATAAVNLALASANMLPGTVDNTAVTATTTVMESDDITEATADHFKGRIIVFTSGALQYQATTITAYAINGGRGHFTYTALTEAPSDNGTFLII